MLAFILRIVNKIAKWFGTGTLAYAGLEVAKWTAGKLLLAAFWFTGVYVLMSKFTTFVMEQYAALVPQLYSDNPGVNTLTMQLTGLGAYLAQHLMLVDSFSVFVAGISLAVLRMFLPLPRF